jgi:hypothetical protein
MKILLITSCILILSVSLSYGQLYSDLEESEQLISISHDPDYFEKYGKLPDSSFYQRKSEWQAIIDSTWGPGLPLANKLLIFDTYTTILDNYFDGFLSLGLNWNSWDTLKNSYRSQINDTTSRGRFCAIMNYYTYELRDYHTKAADTTLALRTPLNPGTPLLFAISFATVEHFGAVETALPDCTALILRVVNNHPLGIQPGDIILGYEGIRYPTLITELMDAQLPALLPWAGAKSADCHILHQFAGMNWHLFDTIDILKYSTGDTVHLPVAPMINLNIPPMVNNEQMEISGIPFPDYLNGDFVSYGIMDNTNIGYIYLFSHRWWSTTVHPDEQFFEAVNALKNTEGLIIDMRFTEGGWAFFDEGFKILFNESPYTLDGAIRCNQTTFDLCPHGIDIELHQIKGNPSSLYDHPIAVLLGPTCLSMGDRTAHRLRYHPMVSFFGKSPNASCGLNTRIGNFPDWFMQVSLEDLYHLNQPGVYLNRTEFPIDFPVWHNPDDAANGIDAVVEAATSWINNMIHAYNVRPHSKFIKSMTDTVTITANVKNPPNHNLNVAALINTLDSVFVDSLPMFDDGNHGDSLAGDGLYGCYVNPLSSEDIFTIGASVTDLYSNHYHILPRATRFTTIGPVRLDTVEITSSDTIPDAGDYLKFKFSLKNWGQSKSADSISSNIVPVDTFASYLILNEIEYGNIAPNQISAGSMMQYIKFSNYCYPGQIVKIANYIFSNGYHYWTDTLYIEIGNGILNVEDDITKKPVSYYLNQNYPNPFNPTTTIEFSIPKTEFVSLKIYNLLGQEVATLVSEKLTPSKYTCTWDASGFASGVYLYKLEAGQFVKSKKLLLIK